MKAHLLWLILFALAPSSALAQCEGLLLAELQSSSPLKAAEADSSFRVSVFDSGCFAAHRPAYDLKAGTRLGQLKRHELRRFVAELESSEIRSVQPELLRQEIDAASRASASSKSASSLWRVSDGDMVDFHIPSATTPNADLRLRWRTLDHDLLNHPGNRQLLGIKAAQTLFRDLDRAVFERESLQ